MPKLDLPTSIYEETLGLLKRAPVAWLVGGAFAFGHYTGIHRDTKDLDIFVRRVDCSALLKYLRQNGYRTEMTFPYWLAKAYRGDYFIDLIFSSANQIAEVDDLWFTRSSQAELWGHRVSLVPVEEMIWSKGFIMERERFDGADIAHLIRAQHPHIAWHHLVERFGENWRVLYAHLILFGYIYPALLSAIPAPILHLLKRRSEKEIPSDDVCRGTLLSRMQYLPDVQDWHLRDARLPPSGRMTPAEIAHWTEAFGQK